MSFHWQQVPTSDEIIHEWHYNGMKLPPIFAITGPNDALAFNCWEYVHRVKNGVTTPLSIFMSELRKEDPDLSAIQEHLLKEVCEKLGLEAPQE